MDMEVVLELMISGEMNNFGVIGGVSSHIFALFQGLLKVLAGVDIDFTMTSKGGDDGEFIELYVPPTRLFIINLITIVISTSNAINNGYNSCGLLFLKLFFAI
eukprot:Gb_40600 [translate_table: standard]